MTQYRVLRVRFRVVNSAKLGFRDYPAGKYKITSLSILACYANMAFMLPIHVAELQSGEDYYWKVIVEDGMGGIAESKTRRFEVK